jgi:uncharacterized YccA/Bax inhibitor family protein
MTETGVALLICIMFVVSFLLYTFDPWLGFALGILTAIVGLIAGLKAATPSRHRTNEKMVIRDEEEPIE